MKSKLATFIFLQVVFFFGFDYFSIFAIAVILLNKIFKKNYFMNYNSNFFKLVTSIFYFGKLLFATNINFLKYWKSTSYSLVSIDYPFIDMHAFLFKVKCNALNENFMYDPLYRTETNWVPGVECENYILPYGPIENLISFNFQNIWSSTLVVVFIFTTILIKIYFDLIDATTEKYKYIIFFLSLSPAVNFLIDRANLDLIIYICIYYIFKNYQNYMVLKLLLLLFFSLLKLHPIFIIFGLLIYFVITKEYKIASLHFLVLLIFTVFFGNWYFNNSFLTPLPSYPGLTFGILSDAILLNRLLNINQVVLYLFITIFVMLFVKINYKNVESFNKMNYSTFSILFWFCCVSVYANNDYRLVLLLFIFNFVCSTKNQVYELSYFLLFLLNPLPLILNMPNEIQMLKAGVYIDINFYFFFAFTIVLLIKQITTLYKN